MHISDLFLKLCIFTFSSELFPFNVGKRVMQSAYENSIFLPMICTKFQCYKQPVNFLFAKCLQIIRNLYSNLLCYPLLLLKRCTIFLVVREITPIKNYNFRIKSGMCKRTNVEFLLVTMEVTSDIKCSRLFLVHGVQVTIITGLLVIVLFFFY